MAVVLLSGGSGLSRLSSMRLLRCIDSALTTSDAISGMISLVELFGTFPFLGEIEIKCYGPSESYAPLAKCNLIRNRIVLNIYYTN